MKAALTARWRYCYSADRTLLLCCAGHELVRRHLAHLFLPGNTQTQLPRPLPTRSAAARTPAAYATCRFPACTVYSPLYHAWRHVPRTRGAAPATSRRGWWRQNTPVVPERSPYVVFSGGRRHQRRCEREGLRRRRPRASRWPQKCAVTAPTCPSPSCRDPTRSAFDWACAWRPRPFTIAAGRGWLHGGQLQDQGQARRLRLLFAFSLPTCCGSPVNN